MKRQKIRPALLIESIVYKCEYNENQYKVDCDKESGMWSVSRRSLEKNAPVLYYTENCEWLPLADVQFFNNKAQFYSEEELLSFISYQ